MKPLEDVARAIDQYLAAETLISQLKNSGHLAAGIDVGGLAFDFTVALFGGGIVIDVFKSIVKNMVDYDLASAADGFRPPAATSQRSVEREHLGASQAASLLEARNLASQLARIPKHGTEERLARFTTALRQKK